VKQKASRQRSTSDARWPSPGPYATWVNEHAQQPLPDDPDAMVGDTIIDGVHHVITVSGHLWRVEPRVMELVEDTGRLVLRGKRPTEPPPPEPEKDDRLGTVTGKLAAIAEHLWRHGAKGAEAERDVLRRTIRSRLKDALWKVEATGTEDIVQKDLLRRRHEERARRVVRMVCGTK
jgi:hypothetical protein